VFEPFLKEYLIVIVLLFTNSSMLN